MPSAEKFSPKPIARELIFKSNESNVFFDVLSSSYSQEYEKFLGNIYVVGHVKYGEEDMGYLVSLISSLAKREYYSETARSLDNPKLAFEHTLKKLNEILEEFFQNKKFNLNMGLMVVAGDSIFLSKLGKFKVLLARNKEIIDIFNNVDLFQKEHIEEKEFSNIISGKTKSDDTIFAFFPSRSLSAREKQLKEILVQASQEEFADKIKNVSENAKNFSCCGFHIQIKKIADIPPANIPFKSAPAVLTQNSPPTKTEAETAHSFQSPEQPLILRDLTKNERKNIFKKFFGRLTALKFGKSVNNRAKAGMITTLLILTVASVGATKFFFLNGESEEFKDAVQQAQNNLKLAQTFLSQNNSFAARQLISSSLFSLSSMPKKEKTEGLFSALTEILDKIDTVKEGGPELIRDLAPKYAGEEKISRIAASGDDLYGFSSLGSLVKISENEIKDIKKIEGIAVKKIFSTENGLAFYNGSEIFVVFDKDSQKVTQYLLKNPSSPKDSDLYEGNLYVLENSIYKYSDITKGGAEKQEWLKDIIGEDSVLAAVDGKIYTISSKGLLSVFFKGKKEKESQLPVSPPPHSGLLTKKDYPHLVFIDPLLKRVGLISKTTGIITGTYKIDGIGTISGWSLNNSGILYILTSDQKIWKLHLN